MDHGAAPVPAFERTYGDCILGKVSKMFSRLRRTVL
jgi:hypothetical protein